MTAIWMPSEYQSSIQVSLNYAPFDDQIFDKFNIQIPTVSILAALLHDIIAVDPPTFCFVQNSLICSLLFYACFLLPRNEYSRDLKRELVGYLNGPKKFFPWMVLYSGHGLNSKLKVRYSRHGLNNELIVCYSGHTGRALNLKVFRFRMVECVRFMVLFKIRTENGG